MMERPLLRTREEIIRSSPRERRSKLFVVWFVCCFLCGYSNGVVLWKQKRERERVELMTSGMTSMVLRIASVSSSMFSRITSVSVTSSIFTGITSVSSVSSSIFTGITSVSSMTSSILTRITSVSVASSIPSRITSIPPSLILHPRPLTLLQTMHTFDPFLFSSQNSLFYCISPNKSQKNTQSWIIVQFAY